MFQFVAAYGFSEFITMVKSGWETAMSLVGKVFSWPLAGFIMAPFVIWALVAVFNKFR